MLKLIIKSNFQFIKYAIAGGIATVHDFVALYVLTEYLQLYYLISATIAFIIGVSINYILSIKWVFDHRKFTNVYHEILTFLLISFIGLVLNNFILWMLTENFLIFYLYSKAIATLMVFMWNYFAKKIIIF